MIQVGDTFPDVPLKTMTDDGIENLTTGGLTAGKKVVLFGIPGAFTPTCTDHHLPGFQDRAADIQAKGVDTIACVSVNDVFVMGAWGHDREIGDDILFLADGNGELAKATGLELDATAFGMGHRCKRFAMIVDDGVVQWIGVEPAGGVTVSGADAVVEQL